MWKAMNAKRQRPVAVRPNAADRVSSRTRNVRSLSVLRATPSCVETVILGPLVGDDCNACGSRQRPGNIPMVPGKLQTVAGAPAFAAMLQPPDRGRYFRAMLVNLITVDVSEYGLQT